MENKLTVSPAPHIRKHDSTSGIMFDVVIALLPATVFAVYNFGAYAAAVIATSVFFCMASEYFYQYFTNRPISLKDGSALVTGLLLGLNMTANVSLWLVIAASVISVLVFKCLFGGIGKNLLNPALAGRVVAFLFTYFTGKGGMLNYGVDAYTSATPLTVLKRAGEIDVAKSIVGLTAGTLGEVSAIALLIGAAYLLYKKVISWEIPLGYIGSFSLYIIGYSMISTKALSLNFIFAHIFSGGLILGAFFMATDYVTSPMSRPGKLIYAVIIGIITGFLRTFSLSFVEGVSFAILIGNLLSPFIDRFCRVKAFGIR